MMTKTTAGVALVLVAVSAGVARADCESDMIQLEDAMKAPNQTPTVKAAYQEAATTAAAAMRKDDDAGCHKTIADAMAKAGKPLK
jgi:hypothetical protein